MCLVETCTNTVPQGTCHVELDTFTKTCEDNICTITIDGEYLESYDMNENFGVSSNYTVTRVNECVTEGFE